MFRTETESRAFFESADFVLAVAAVFLAGDLLQLFLQRTRLGRGTATAALCVLFVASCLVLYGIARVLVLATEDA